MKKFVTIFLTLITIFITISSSAFADTQIVLDANKIRSNDLLENAIADLNLGIGDHLVELVNGLIGEDVTIQKLVFNQIDAVNPNFFDKTLVDEVSATSFMRDIVTEWYNFFMVLTIAVYIISLLVIGINILALDVASALAKTKQILIKWVVGVMILFCFPVIIRFVFTVNDAIVGMIYSAYVGTSEDAPNNSTAEEWSKDIIEFRSPEYVSRFTGATALTTDEYTKVMQAQLNSYKANKDMLRIMRAYAGVTKKIIYVIIWMILFWQTVVMLIKYYKRYFIIAMLITIFPLVCLYYIIDVAKGKNGQVFSNWAKELIINIMIQSVHAIIYAIISSVVINRIMNDIASGADTMNWILIIVSVNFLSEGEKIVRKILGASASTVTGVGDTGKAVRKGIGDAGQQARQILPKGGRKR